MINVSKKSRIVLALGTLLIGTSAFSAHEFTPPEELSSGGDGFKTKLIRMGNGMLVSAFGDSVASANNVYDLKADGVRKARDIFIRTCMPSPTDLSQQCSSLSEWSSAENISNTADLTSISSKWERDATTGIVNDTAAPFYGDSEKPNIFNAGTFAVVTWVDKYCTGGEQLIVSYTARNGLEVPFSCVYESHINFADTNPAWTAKQQLTSGKRDAKQDVNKGVSLAGKGQWIITWQEDPHGLQIGGGDGPGEGASGAGTSHGTDIWYTMTSDLVTDPFSQVPARLTDNYENDDDRGNHSPVYQADGTTEVTVFDSGTVGASRANTAIVNVDGEASPTVIIAYEETKGTDQIDNGKYVRYHSFPFTTPEVEQPGAVISDFNENARRVRFVPQVKAGANGLRMGIFWRQGEPTGGGPGDIMVRLGFKDSAVPESNGLRMEDFEPAVDSGAKVSPYADVILLNNEPAFNISSNTIPWSEVGGEVLASTNTLNDTTTKNPYENARAHRAVIRGDDFYIGYTYAKDWAVATYTDMDNYNFWMRRYNALTSTWTDAKNLSNITDVKIHAKEPRLVGMPGNGPGCTDPANITNPENCQDKSTLLVAWGTQTNVYDHISGSVEGDIYYTRTNDKAETFNGISVVDGKGVSSRFESQLRSTPAGNIVYTVWNEDTNVNGAYSMLSVSTSDDGTVGVGTPPANEPAITTLSSSSSGGGCSYNPNNKNFDMTFFLMMGLVLLYPFRKRFIK